MKSRALTWIAAISLFATLATPVRVVAQEEQQQQAEHLQRYIVTDLGTLGGTSSYAVGINNEGWVTGEANLPGDHTGHAALWRRGEKGKDLGTLCGPNSAVYWPVKDDIGLITGVSDTSNKDPLGEDFCAYGTGLICRGFVWYQGLMFPFPTLGGNNSQATGVNNRGQVVGYAENSTQNPNCVAPQVLD